MKEYYLDYLIKTQKFPQSVYHKTKHDLSKQLILELPHGSIILDAACGIGNVTGIYCDDYHIVGVDEQQSAIDYCKSHYKGKYIKADLYNNLPFPDNHFDLILFHDSIEHLEKPRKALKELVRVLKKDKKIIISTINYNNPLWPVLENTWHRLMGGNCRTFSKEVHPTRYTADLLENHCGGIFKELELQKRVFGMELFYIGKKP
jgi:ubiquinone/menaquinone biosynthesis C-methylase UbiE